VRPVDERQELGLPSRPRTYGPEDLEREQALDQAMRELGADSSRMRELDMKMAQAAEERRAIEDRIAKTAWLIEQLRERD
jgi:hypothetical protein